MDRPPGRRRRALRRRPTPRTWSPCPRTPTSSPAATRSTTASATTRASASPPAPRPWPRCSRARATAPGAFVSAFPLDSRFGLDRGFDVYDDRLGDPEARTAFLMQERPGARTVDAARHWRARPGRGADLHVDPPLRAALPLRAARAVRLALRAVALPRRGRLHGRAARARARAAPRGRKDGRTLVVLTGDHGEGLGEHGEKTHGIFAYETTLRVPADPLRAAAAARRASSRSACATSTSCRRCSTRSACERPTGLAGRSLLAARQRRDAARRRRATSRRSRRP